MSWKFVAREMGKTGFVALLSTFNQKPDQAIPFGECTNMPKESHGICASFEEFGSWIC